jgi:hypothetical protein
MYFGPDFVLAVLCPKISDTDRSRVKVLNNACVVTLIS